MPDIFDASRQENAKTTDSVVDQPLVTEQDPLPPTVDRPIDNTEPNRNVNDYSQIMANESPSRNPLQAFAAKPERTYFDSQLSEEQVLLLLRQHPVTQIKWVVIAFLLIITPFFLSFVPLLDFLPARFHLVAGVAWYLMVIGFSLEAFLDWFFNVYIVTDERIIDVDFNSLLFKNVSYAKTDKIEDITFTVSGSLGAVFDYGTVTIQTAATVSEFEFEHVPHPSKVTQFINELIIEEEREKIEGRLN